MDELSHTVGPVGAEFANALAVLQWNRGREILEQLLLWFGTIAESQWNTHIVQQHAKEIPVIKDF